MFSPLHKKCTIKGGESCDALKKIFITGKLYIENINTSLQEFSISGFIRIIWRDQYILNSEQRQKCKKFGSHNTDWKTIKNADEYIAKFNKPLKTNKFYLPIPLQWWTLETTFTLTNNIESLFCHDNHECPSEIYELHFSEIDEHECLYWQNLHIKATFQEFFEMDQFPFDKQFLNINFRYYTKKFIVVDGIEELGLKDVAWYKEDGGNTLSVPFQCKLCDNVWTSEWNVLTPYIDFNGKKNYSTSCRSKYLSIKLRVERKATHYLLYSLFPIFIITTCSFAIYWLNVEGDICEEYANKLSYILTLLLTITATQLSASGDLPNLATRTIIDKYICCCYVLLFLFICPFTIFPKALHQAGIDNEDLKNLFETICIGIFAIFWSGASFLCLGGIKWISYFTESWNQRLQRENKCWNKDDVAKQWKQVDAQYISTNHKCIEEYGWPET